MWLLLFLVLFGGFVGQVEPFNVTDLAYARVDAKIHGETLHFANVLNKEDCAAWAYDEGAAAYKLELGKFDDKDNPLMVCTPILNVRNFDPHQPSSNTEYNILDLSIGNRCSAPIFSVLDVVSHQEECPSELPVCNELEKIKAICVADAQSCQTNEKNSKEDETLGSKKENSKPEEITTSVSTSTPSTATQTTTTTKPERNHHCPKEYQYIQVLGQCVTLKKLDLEHKGADLLEQCKNYKDGKAVIITNSEQNDAVAKIVKGRVEAALIGLRIPFGENWTWSGFKWISGTALNYKNWAKSEPNNQQSQEFYTALNGETGLWQDVDHKTAIRLTHVVCTHP